MSEPALFVIIRDGEKRYYGDHWANAFLFRELLWGPEALEQWLATDEELGEWFGDAEGGAVIDLDQRRLTWSGASEPLEVQHVFHTLQRMLEAAWPGFQIEYADPGALGLAQAAGEATDWHENVSPLEDRPMSVREAAGIYDDEDEDANGRLVDNRDHNDLDDDDLDDDEADGANSSANEMNDDELRAWLTVVNANGTVRHWHFSEFSQDILSAKESALSQLATLDITDVPDEAWVKEGLWIDRPRKQIGYWGGASSKRVFPAIQQSWRGWAVRWSDNGYAQQCAVSGPGGIPMSDEQALAKLVPIALSVKRIDVAAIFGAIGGQFKKSIVKGVGCFTFVLCIPVLLFGLISGNLKAAGITILIVIGLVFTAYKVIAGKLKRKFAMPMLRQANPNKPPVAGPLDPKQRRAKLEATLAAAGLPPLAKVEPHIDANSDIMSLLN